MPVEGDVPRPKSDIVKTCSRVSRPEMDAKMLSRGHVTHSSRIWQPRKSLPHNRVDFKSKGSLREKMNETSTPIALHRCRFVDYSPSPITALAFPPLPLPSRSTPKLGKERDGGRGAKFGTLVAGHANGNIDLLEWTGEVDELQAPQVWQLRKVSTQVGLYSTDSGCNDNRLFRDPTHQK